MSDLDTDFYEPVEGPSKEAKLAAATEEADFKWLMADPRGRRFAQRLLERSGVFRSSFVGDPNITAFREGERNVGLRLIADVQNYAPEWIAEVLSGKGANESRS